MVSIFVTQLTCMMILCGMTNVTHHAGRFMELACCSLRSSGPAHSFSLRQPNQNVLVPLETSS